VFIHSEASNNDEQPKNGGKPENNGSLGSIRIEQIPDLIANAVKAQLG